MWVRFSPQTTGAYEVSTCNEGTLFDTAIAIYEVGECNDYSSYTVISSNDDSYRNCEGGNGYASTCYISCLEIGTDYYIQIDGWGGGSGDVELTLTSYEEEPEIESLVTNVACANVKGGAGSVALPQVIGLGINYDVAWEGPSNFSSTDRIIRDIAPGDYTCTINNACGFSGETVITVEVAEPVVIDFFTTNTSCLGAGNGAVDPSISGGNDPYSLVWTLPSGATLEEDSLSSLSEGNYLLELTDDNDCVYNGIVTVGTDLEFTFSLGEDQMICSEESINIEGPSGFYIYEWHDDSENSSYIFSAAENEIGDHTVSLTITNQDGCVYTDVATITVDDCLGIDDLVSNEFLIYPNPANDYLYLDLSKISHASNQVKIYNHTGELVLSKRIYDNASIDLAGFSSGIYLVQILGEKNVHHTARVVVNGSSRNEY